MKTMSADCAGIVSVMVASKVTVSFWGY